MSEENTQSEVLDTDKSKTRLRILGIWIFAICWPFIALGLMVYVGPIGEMLNELTQSFHLIIRFLMGFLFCVIPGFIGLSFLHCSKKEKLLHGVLLLFVYGCALLIIGLIGDSGVRT